MLNIRPLCYTFNIKQRHKQKTKPTKIYKKNQQTEHRKTSYISSAMQLENNNQK